MAEESKKTGEASVSEESKKTAPKDTKPKEKRPGFFKKIGNSSRNARAKGRKLFGHPFLPPFRTR